MKAGPKRGRGSSRRRRSSGGSGAPSSPSKSKKSWVQTNPKTLETYRFEKLPNGTIRTVAFLGYKTPSGKLVKKQKPLMSNGEKVTLIGAVHSGEFVSGTKWRKVDSVKVGNETFDSKTTFHWEDPDFPHDDHVQKAVNAARKADEHDPERNWAEYLDYSEAEYSFKSNGFMIYPDGRGGVDVDALPKGVGLGRIPVKELSR